MYTITNCQTRETVLRTLANSLHTIRPRGVEEFVGLANYAELLRDGIFWKAVGNTLIWAGVAPVLDVGVGFGRWGIIVREFCDVWFARVPQNSRESSTFPLKACIRSLRSRVFSILLGSTQP